MDFYAVLDQVIALLRQRGKASYRALKLQFTLDDTALNVLKDELITVHQLARDQDGEMLVWTGETDIAQAVATQHAQTTPPATAQGKPLLQVASPPYGQKTRGSCWIPGSWMCRGRLPRLLPPKPSLNPLFFNGLTNALRLSDKVGA